MRPTCFFVAIIPQVLCKIRRSCRGRLYSHLVRLVAESDRIYNFFRGLDGSWKPSWVFSEDGGASWRRGGILIDVPSQDPQRPYLKVRSRETDSIHFVYTEGHPRDVDNSLFHVVYRDRWLRRSGGGRTARLERGLAAPKKGTRIFAGRPDVWLGSPTSKSWRSCGRATSLSHQTAPESGCGP